jgi:hypothetical protein
MMPGRAIGATRESAVGSLRADPVDRFSFAIDLARVTLVEIGARLDRARRRAVTRRSVAVAGVYRPSCPDIRNVTVRS